MKKINCALFTGFVLFSAISFAQEAQEIKYTNLALMKPCYKGEELTPPKPTCLLSHNFTVKYFDLTKPEDMDAREKYRVVIIDKTVRKADSTDVVVDYNGKKNYVLGEDGSLYIFDEKLEESVRHSSFYSGGPVAAAGNLKIKNGEITSVNDHSGHYEMTEQAIKNMHDYLLENGIDVADETN